MRLSDLVLCCVGAVVSGWLAGQFANVMIDDAAGAFVASAGARLLLSIAWGRFAVDPRVLKGGQA